MRTVTGGLIATVCAGAAIGTMIGISHDSTSAQGNAASSPTATSVRVKRAGQTHRVSRYRPPPQKPQPAGVSSKYRAGRRVVIEPGLSISDSLLRRFGFVAVEKPLPKGVHLVIAGKGERAVHVERGDLLVIEWRPFE